MVILLKPFLPLHQERYVFYCSVRFGREQAHSVHEEVCDPIVCLIITGSQRHSSFIQFQNRSIYHHQRERCFLCVSTTGRVSHQSTCM